MLNTFLNIIISIALIPVLLVFFVYVFLRKIFQPKWSAFGNETANCNESGRIVGIPFKNISFTAAMQLVKRKIVTGERRNYFFLNPHAINLAKKDPQFLQILSNNEINFPDGMGMKLAGIFEGYQLRDNLCGTDLYLTLMDLALEENFSVYFLGGNEEVIENFYADAKKRWPNLNIVGRHHGYFDKANESEKIVEEINLASPDILLVSFGMPLQEKWIVEYGQRLNSKANFATGGLFDFYSGRIKRAPLAWRQIGLEWLYRLLKEPGRMWKRYIIGNPLFLTHVIKWKYLKI